MRLFYAPDASSLAPHIVLHELQLPFTLDRVDRTTWRTRSGADFSRLNPKRYVPAVELDDGEVLTEGPAITQYLADCYAPGILAPLSGTVARARMNASLNFIGTELHKPFDLLFALALPADTRATITASLGQRLEFIDSVLAQGGPYLTGQQFSLADAYLFVVQRWAPMTGVDLASFPHLLRFVDRVASRASVKAALAAEADDAPA